MKILFVIGSFIVCSCLSYRPFYPAQKQELLASDFEIAKTYRMHLVGAKKPIIVKIEAVEDSLIYGKRMYSETASPTVKIYLNSISYVEKGKFSFIKTYFLVGICILPISIPLILGNTFPFDEFF